VNLALVLQMALSAHADRTAVTASGRDVSVARLAALAQSAASRFLRHGAEAVLYLGGNTAAYPVALFGAAYAGVPLVPLNYRLSGQQLAALLADHPGAVLVHDESSVPLNALAAQAGGLPGVGTADLLALEPVDELDPPQDGDAVAVLLYTSGTTAAPKAAVLRHRHLLAYLFGTVEFGAAEPDEAALVTVPPYHVAGLTNLLSNVYAGRRIVYLTASRQPSGWRPRARSA